jgi:hypothetical protein
MAALNTSALEMIQDSLMGIRTRQVAPVAEVRPLLPFTTNMADFPGGRIFVRTGSDENFIRSIDIYCGYTRYRFDVTALGTLSHVRQLVDDYEGLSWASFEVFSWPVSHEGTTVRSLAGPLPNDVANALYAVGLLVL